MATNPNPNRQPAGTPRGGQFAPGAHPESGVVLDGDDEPRPSSDRSYAASGNVRVRLSTGLPSFAMPGATAGAERGMRDRVRAAFINSNIAWPLRRIEVSQQTWVPGRVDVDGTAHPEAPQDLAVAAGLLEASGAVPEGACDDAEMIGRLGLDGSVHPVDPEVAQRIAERTSARSIFVAPGQDLSAPPGVETVEVANLRNLADRMEIAANRRAADAAQAGRDEAIAYLSRDGDLSVPASRYGRTTSECAEVAWRAARVVADEAGGGPVTHEDLDYAMYLTVNDHDDIANLLPEEEF